MPVGDPFTDTVGENALVVSRGSYAFLKASLEVNDALVAPDSDAFQLLDVVKILDPDGNDVTSSWETKDLDPTDAADVYNGAHATYVGLQAKKTVADGVTTSGSPIITSATAAFNDNDIGKPVVGTGIPGGATIASRQSATQVTLSANATATGTGVSLTIGTENVGLFHDGGGRLAQKIRVPSNAEITSSSSTRHWKVRWRVKKNGAFIVAEETFDVTDVGQVVFSDSVVSVAQVRRGYTTPLTDAQIRDLLVQAAADITVTVGQVGVTIPSPAPDSIINATIYQCHAHVIRKEVSEGRAVNSVGQGGMSLGMMSVEKRIEDAEKAALKMVMAFLATKGIYGLKLAKAYRFARGDLAQANLQRQLAWFWRDY